MNGGLNCSLCLDLGPPPDMILTIPPPPMPAFLQLSTPNHSSPPPCSAPCDLGNAGVEFIEVPRNRDGGSVIDDTWLFVLISCSVGVLLLGSLLALVLLKCREERTAKGPLQLEPATLKPGPCEAVLYPGSDSRTLWATLTPRGTLHHIAADHRPHHHHYHTHHSHHHNHNGHHHHHHHFHYQEPEYYEPEDYCLRPRIVSSPTRIENPNLPPLNLHRTLRRPPADHTPVL